MTITHAAALSTPGLALAADTPLSGARLVRELTLLIGLRGKLLTVMSDNGTELTSSSIPRWSKDHRVEWHYIAAGRVAINSNNQHEGGGLYF